MSWTFVKYSLAELVDDPLVGLVMRSDGVNRAELSGRGSPSEPGTERLFVQLAINCMCGGWEATTV